jgi:uncharacterized protein
MSFWHALTVVRGAGKHAPMLPETALPLSQVDLARLNQFLQSPACGGEAMGLSHAHGFLTALASGPELLEPSEWLRLMFDEPVFASGDDAQEMLGLAMRLYADIEQGLRGEAGFRPVLEYVRDDTGATHVDAQRWCRGFVSGFSLFRERWTREARGALDMPLSVIFKLAEMPGVADPTYARLCEALPDAAGAVYRYWQAEGRR